MSSRPCRVVTVARRHVLEKREMQQVDVEMHDVEVVRAASTSCSIDRWLARSDFSGAGVQSEGLSTREDRRGRVRMRRGEQRDVMALLDQGVGKVGHHALGAAVEAGWNGFVEWCDSGRSSSSLPEAQP